MNGASGRTADRQVVGVIPAAGTASRLAPLPLSKELYPIGFQSAEGGQSFRPKPVAQYLLEKMSLAGIRNVYLILRPGKWDIPAYFADGARFNLNIAYLLMGLPYGAPFTVDRAYPFLHEAVSALGLPDILFDREDVYVRLLDKLERTQAELVLGLFLTDHPEKSDMVEFDEQGWVKQILIKPAQTKLRYSWAAAVWNPAFTHYLHAHLESLSKRGEEYLKAREWYLGDVIRSALEDGMPIAAVAFRDEAYIDIGTPEGLEQALGKYGMSISGY